MIISATFSKPVSNVQEILGRDYKKIKAKAVNSNGKTSYFFELFTETQVFHENKSEEELNDFIEKNAGKTFKNVVIKTEKDETTILSNKKGKITRLTKNILQREAESVSQKEKNDSSLKRIFKNQLESSSESKTKNYILREGKPIPFLVVLGIMTDEGKVISSKFDKFRQINRFLEFIDDILPDVLKLKEKPNEPIKIIDFGSGKSYLTFAVHYFLIEIKKLEVQIIGLDLKENVIQYCRKIAENLNLKGISFEVGNISDYQDEFSPDIVITLHACDTATDFALDYAVKNNAKAILSVPCCQHEINQQLDENLKRWKKSENIPELFKPILKYGIEKERFSAILTDVLRCDALQECGYSVNLMEFIGMENTPKNLLIRAVKKSAFKPKDKKELEADKKILETLEIKPTCRILTSNL